MSKIIGIDLGTTNSAVACMDRDDAQIIRNGDGRKTTPSVVCFHDQEIEVGMKAKKLEYMYPEEVVNRIKRKMGTDYRYHIHNRDYSPEEISAYILKHLKDIAEEKLGETVSDAIITVPAYFNDNQRQATKTAGKLAGLNVIRIINEPTAASLSYGIRSTDDLNVLVYDLGGGTFDVSVLNVADGIFEVVSTSGDNNLGGEDFNHRLIELVLNRFYEETDIDLKTEPLAMVKIAEAVEKVKIELSSKDKSKVEIPFVTADENGPKNIDFEVTRKDFENLIKDYIERTVDLSKQAVEDGGLDINDIDRIILVGGSSRIPYVQNSVKQCFGKDIDNTIDPDEVVARGAALQGGIIQGDVSGIVLVDVNPISLGIEVENGYFVPIIERNSPIPTSAKRIFTTVADGQRSVEVHVMQGESMYSKNNISLGNFKLEGIRNATKGDPRIEVTFELDVNGILNVSAVDIDTRSAQGITLVNNSRITEEEMENLKDFHLNHYQEEIQKRGALNSVLKMKTKADNIVARINETVPPAYKRSLIKNEIEEIMVDINDSVKEINPQKIEKNVSRLEFIMDELIAGSYNFNDMADSTGQMYH